ncbi:Clp protease N-terminal domain-containing protein [Actinomycetospora chlora]|uniref:Clp protease N-terminal domain-containing protein n=1 Tax=Actinomycetospora chlora TaxID=663608 RepID=UPI0031EAB709
MRPEPSPDEPRPVAWARGLGAIQEAERLGSWRVGSEHLLLATLLDPVVRRLLFEAGVDVGLQRRIGRPLRTGIGAPPGILPRTAEMALSDGAVRLLATLEERTRTDAALAGWVRPDHTTDPQGRSIVRRHLLVTLLDDAEPGAARTLLDEHGVDTHAGWLAERLVGRA